MTRFLHTADWQLGLRVRFIHGDDGAAVREARLETVRSIGRVATERDVDFVVVAGDVFEHHGLKPQTLRRTFDALREYPCPVYLLPGNHDPLTADSLYLGKIWKREAPDNVRVLQSKDPVEAPGGATILPCPLLERDTLDDLTRHLRPTFGPQGVVRVGVAHGGVKEFLARMLGPDEQVHNPIARDAAERGGLDYLALGDWHGVLKITDRTWYSGAPEATRFKEKDPGQVLVVEIAGPGGPPLVEQVRVATQTWVQRHASVDSRADIDTLEAGLEALTDKASTLVELFLEGTLDAATDVVLGKMLERHRSRLRWMRRRDEKLSVLTSEEDLAEIADAGWLGDVVRDLQGQAAQDPIARSALLLLYRLHQEGAS